MCLKGRRMEYVLKMEDWDVSFGTRRICFHNTGPRISRALSECHSVK